MANEEVTTATSLNQDTSSALEDVLQEKVAQALKNLCHQCLDFDHYVSVTGTVIFDIDGTSELRCAVSQTVVAPLYSHDDLHQNQSLYIDKKPDIAELQLVWKSDIDEGTNESIDSAPSKRKRGRPSREESVVATIKSRNKDAKNPGKRPEARAEASYPSKRKGRRTAARTKAAKTKQVRRNIEEAQYVENTGVVADQEEDIEEDTADGAWKQESMEDTEQDEPPTALNPDLSDIVEKASLSCPNCDFVDTEMEAVRKHRKLHHGAFLCPHCSFVADKRSKLSTHLEENHLENKGKDGDTNISKDAVNKDSSPNETFICPSLKVKEGGESDISIESDADPVSPGPTMVVGCPSLAIESATNLGSEEIFDDKEKPNLTTEARSDGETRSDLGLKSHKLSSVEKKRLTCKQCGFQTKHRGSLHRHYKLHTGKIFCSMCTCSFQSQTDLKRHIRYKHGEPVSCNLCDKSFRSPSGLKLHKDRVHEHNFLYVCSFCGRGFQAIKHYTGHVNKHKNIKPYQCTLCGTCFTFETSLKKHKCSIKKKDTVFPCLICNKVFNKREALNDHRRGAHSVDGSKAYACHCGVTFKWRGSLCNHRKTCSVAKVT